MQVVYLVFSNVALNWKKIKKNKNNFSNKKEIISIMNAIKFKEAKII